MTISHAEGVTEPAARATLRAELDGLVAHLYGLTEDEFAYILTTFPLVAQPVKDATLEAFRTFKPKPGDPEIAALLANPARVRAKVGEEADEVVRAAGSESDERFAEESALPAPETVYEHVYA